MARPDDLRSQFKLWRQLSAEDRAGFFAIYGDFLPYLGRLSGNAIKLYVYLGLHAGNFTGECWPSVPTMARRLKKSQRTILSWLKELERCKLIMRIPGPRGEVTHTFLLPYGSRAFEVLRGSSDEAT